MKKILTCLLLLLLFSAKAQKKKLITYDRFGGKITVIAADAIKYDDDLLILYDIQDRLMPVFESGILYPEVFRRSEGLTDSIPSATKGHDDLKHRFTVQNFHITASTSKSGKIRRFKFMLYRTGVKNPNDYTIELWNPKGSWKSDIGSFIGGARLLTIVKGKVIVF